MQNDRPLQQEAPSPHPDPSSPSFPSLHRHHQPTQPAEPYRDASPSGSILRRRHHLRDGDIIRLDIRTPFENGVSGTKEGYPVHRATTVRELKDGIAEGQYGQDVLWTREGMRIVWQGRIVRDEESIGDVVANSRSTDAVHAVHLVARRLGGTPAIPHLAGGYFPQPTPIPTETVPPPITTNSPPTVHTSLPHPETQALLDSIHYLLFTARHHLFHLVGREPLRWGETVPPPVVDAEVARNAVMSVMRTIVDARSAEEREVWTGWETAFVGGDVADIRRIWEASSRDAIEEEVTMLWRARVGREWTDSPKGQMAQVEIDHIVYQLQLPRLSSLTATQLIHLRIYLKITTLLPLLYPFLPQPASLSDRPAPTPSDPLPTRATFRASLSIIPSRFPRIPLPVLNHMFFQAFKLVAMLWMMTQGMPWSDRKLWIIGGAATGWWIADGYQRYLRDRPRNQNAAAVPGHAPPGPAAPGEERADPHLTTAPAAPVTSLSPHLVIPMVHLSTDTTQLRLINDTLNPARQIEIARTPTPPARRPSKIVTQFLLPIALWIITLIPEFEAIRSRTIRRRERAMRVLIGELNTPVPGAGDGAQVEDRETTTTPPAEMILPQGLNEVARQYYLRTMERGEGIDWEEEREAQRAMGIGREEEEGGGGFIGLF